MLVGDLAYDEALGSVVMIIAINPSWTCGELDGVIWDFEVIADGARYYADADELKAINNHD